MLIYLIYVILGITTGLVAGLLGLGGGVIVVPSLIIIFKLLGVFPDNYIMQLAVGTSLATMFFTTASSVLFYHRERLVEWHVFWNFVPGLFFGVASGIYIAKQIPSDDLVCAFGSFLMLIAIYIFFQTAPEKPEHKFTLHPKQRFIIFALSLIVGLLAAFFGIGGGVLVIPILIFLGLSIRQSAAIAAGCGFVCSVVGSSMLIVFEGDFPHYPGLIGLVYWHAALIIAITSTLFAPVGVRMALILPAKTLRKFFAIILFAVGLHMIDPIFKSLI